MIVIVGLGNPTPKYDKTRHNVGFDLIDKLANKYNIAVNNKAHRAHLGKGVIEGKKVILAKPQTFMNISGESVRSLLTYYKIDSPEQLIVLYDDISLPEGSIRIRKKGSAGGHNGIKSIIKHLGSEEFLRIRIGVGEKPNRMDLADYVLSRFSKAERVLVEQSFDDAVDALQLILKDDIDGAMNKWNRKKGS